MTSSLSVQGGGDFTITFCQSTADCPGNNYCAVIMCVDVGIFGEIVAAINNAYNQVRALLASRLGRARPVHWPAAATSLN